MGDEHKTYGVLFLCTGNSARSVMSESLLNHRGAGRFRACSAGSHPTGRVNPLAIEQLERAGIPTAGLRSKSWDEFAAPGAPHLDFIFTVCDNAAGEACPLWPGQPVTAHWGVPDPPAVGGSEDDQRKAFHEAFVTLARRIDLLVDLPIQDLDAPTLAQRLREIGRA
jgi:arsenate reductase